MHKVKNFGSLTQLGVLVSLGIVWGTGYSIARYCMTHGVPPLGYSFWQSLGPALVLTCLCFCKTKAISVKPQALLYYLFCGIVGISLPNSIMYFGAAHLPSSILVILVNTVPLMIYPLSLISKQEYFSFARVSALGLGIIGILIVIGHNHPLPRLNNIPWTLIVLLSPICFASCAVFINPLQPKGMSALHSATGMLIASSIVLLPVLLHESAFFKLGFNLVSLLIISEIALSSLGYILFFQLIKIAGPVYYSLVAGVVTITGLFWGYTIFAEKLSMFDYIGAALIFIGIIALSLLQKRSAESY